MRNRNISWREGRREEGKGGRGKRWRDRRKIEVIGGDEGKEGGGGGEREGEGEGEGGREGGREGGMAYCY